MNGGVLKRQADGREKKQTENHPNQIRKMENVERVHQEVEKRKRDCAEQNICFYVRIMDQ